jgi:hypothetical protein
MSFQTGFTKDRVRLTESHPARGDAPVGSIDFMFRLLGSLLSHKP